MYIYIYIERERDGPARPTSQNRQKCFIVETQL